MIAYFADEESAAQREGVTGYGTGSCDKLKEASCFTMYVSCMTYAQSQPFLRDA